MAPRSDCVSRGRGETDVAGEEVDCQNLVQYHLEYVVLSDKSDGENSRFTTVTIIKHNSFVTTVTITSKLCWRDLR